MADDPRVKRLSPMYEGSYRSYLRQRLSPRTAERVQFLPYVSHDDVVHYLQCADVFVQPSVWAEPFPLSVLEALAAGVPVVASRTGGLVECISHGETGLLVEPDDATALADALLQLLEDGDQRRQMGARARQRAVEEFSWGLTVRRLTSLYARLGPRSPGRSQID